VHWIEAVAFADEGTQLLSGQINTGVDLRPDAMNEAFLAVRQNKSRIDANHGCNLSQSELFQRVLSNAPNNSIDNFSPLRYTIHIINLRNRAP
jgi:hypothetical protein